MAIALWFGYCASVCSLAAGRRLNVHIEIQSDPQIMAVYENAIKVTADGPREPRSESPSDTPFHNMLSVVARCL